MRVLLVFAFCSLLISSGFGQVWKDALKKTASDVSQRINTKENWDKAALAAQSHLSKARAEFDSTDFDYAILVSDNSGLLDIKEKGERASKVNLAASNF